ncbi:CAP domain-containing protein [Deinococcus altitudinis]|uniref:CAP domain-containing protein n=1 Tax=Deinococcus altitudinis TaxID=468914 RepID=UPI00389294B7
MKQLKTAFTLALLLGASAAHGTPPQLAKPAPSVTLTPARSATLQADAVRVGAVPLQAASVQAPKLQVSSSAEGQLLARLNQIRAAGVSCPGSGPRPATTALRSAGSHAASAFKQASYMAQSGEVSHIGPGGTTPRVRAASSGIQTVSVTEIIYLGSRLDPEAAIRWWLHSPLHCSIMTDGRYTLAGASVVRGNRGTAYVMVLTSTPK